MTQSSAESRQRAIDLAAETMGELIAFWGFKASMGRIWTLLYLSPSSLPADVIAERTQLSAGAVSMALDRAPAVGDRRSGGPVRRTEAALQGRDGRVGDRPSDHPRSRAPARRAIGGPVHPGGDPARGEPEPAPGRRRGRVHARPARGLLGLSQIGYRLVESFAERGLFTLDPIRGALKEQDGV